MASLAESNLQTFVARLVSGETSKFSPFFKISKIAKQNMFSCHFLMAADNNVWIIHRH